MDTRGNGNLSKSEEQALEELVLLANQWRLSSNQLNGGDQGVISKDVILKFLMARKFDVQRALELFQEHQVMRIERGLNALDINDDALKAELESGKFTVLTTKDRTKDQGAAIAVFTARLHKPHERIVTLQSILIQLDCAIAEWETQRNGLVVIYDMSDMPWSNSDVKLAWELQNILKGSFPARLKKILVVGMPFWLKMHLYCLGIFKPLTAKMLERLFFMTVEELPKHVPLDSLPDHLGGTYHHSHSNWLEQCFKKFKLPAASSGIKLRSNSKNGVVPGKADGRRSGQVFQPESEINRSSDLMDELKNPVSLHKQSDKGMGVLEFVQLIHKMGKEGILKEYEELRAASRALPDDNFSVCRLPENRAKNRYMDVPCFDSSRVKLISCDSKNDYIHANFVDGYEQKNAYISTQGPMPKTYNDFWTMIWEQETRVIVMTTRTVERGRQKCGQYWPAQVGETLEIPEFVVKNDFVQHFAHHVQTNLTLTHIPVTYQNRTTTENDVLSTLQGEPSMESRKIIHLQFTDWPDYGVPHSAQSMFEFIQIMRKFQEDAVKSMSPVWSGTRFGPPIVIHCSAGIGRSGSLCALDICMRRLDDCGLVNLNQTVQKTRSQRCHSIQMPEQYLFCYLALAEYAVTKRMISHEDAGLDEMLTWLQDE